MSKGPEPLSSGHGVQIVAPSEEHTFVLDEEALRRLLLQNDVKDRAVVLVSVAGAYRKGKSFLLDFFLRYLQHTYNEGGEGEWLGSEDAELKGFSWKGGSDRHTTGIHIWSQPFKATLESGEKVVILLMDTQGTFDSESTVKDNATVFALSTMLSSVQIYNLSQNIEEDDLQHLQLFMDYGCVAKDKIEGKPFQRLQFLVRDWSYPYNHAYGAVGGQQLLDKRLEVKEGQHEELQKLRQHITRCFEEFTCFLMPHPGLKVATDPSFAGKLSDIQPEFKQSLKELVPMLLDRRNLVPKVIDGQKVKARDLPNYFKSYIDIFNSEELPKPTTILQATAEANNRSAMSEASEVYKTLMDEICGGSRPYLQPARLQAEHWKTLNKALHSFDSKKKMGGEEMSDTFRKELVKELEDLYSQLAAHNEGKNVYRILGTPIVFLTLMILGYLLGVVAAAFGVQTLVAAGQAITLGAAVMLGVWGYTRMTGNMREIGMQLDDIATTLRSYVHQQAFDSLSTQHMNTTTATYVDDKKDS
ncbi:atlastin-like [Anticarsia gemmatalis]|uniref:atlastin-like n=1 Tax=Anticarsia gemmatalis TaxID=129554 RepID=UPI003F76C989